MCIRPKYNHGAAIRVAFLTFRKLECCLLSHDASVLCDLCGGLSSGRVSTSPAHGGQLQSFACAVLPTAYRSKNMLAHPGSKVGSAPLSSSAITQPDKRETCRLAQPRAEPRATAFLTTQSGSAAAGRPPSRPDQCPTVRAKPVPELLLPLLHSKHGTGRYRSRNSR